MSSLLPIIVSALHVIALGLALGGLWARGAAMKRQDVPGILAADNAWGLAVLLIIITGLWRAFGGLEKGTAYYLASTAFHLKMGLFGLIFLLELGPMVTFIQWRIQRAKEQELDLSNVPLFYKLNSAELLLVIQIPFVAAAMARGLGAG